MEGECEGVQGSRIPSDTKLGVPLSIRTGMGNVGFLCLLGRNLCKKGHLGSQYSVVQECTRLGVSSSTWTQVFGFPYWSRRTLSKCSKSMVLWSIGTKFTQTTGDSRFPSLIGGRACKNQVSPLHDENNLGSPVQVQETRIPWSIMMKFV